MRELQQLAYEFHEKAVWSVDMPSMPTPFWDAEAVHAQAWRAAISLADRMLRGVE